MEKILNMKFVIVLLMVMATSAFVTRGSELNWDGKKYCSSMVCKLGTGDVFCTADCSPRGWTHGVKKPKRCFKFHISPSTPQQNSIISSSPQQNSYHHPASPLPDFTTTKTHTSTVSLTWNTTTETYYLSLPHRKVVAAVTAFSLCSTRPTVAKLNVWLGLKLCCYEEKQCVWTASAPNLKLASFEHASRLIKLELPLSLRLIEDNKKQIVNKEHSAYFRDGYEAHECSHIDPSSDHLSELQQNICMSTINIKEAVEHHRSGERKTRKGQNRIKIEQKREASSSKLSRDQTSNPTSSTNPTPKGRIRRSSKQKVENSNFEEHLTPVSTMTDNRTMAEMLRAPTEGAARRWLEKEPSHQDSLNAAAGGNLLEKSPQDALTIIENKSKVRNSRSKPIASLVNACDINSSSEIAKLTHAVNQQTSAVTTVMTAMLKQLQANPPPAQVKAVEKICVTCGGAHPYYQCLAAAGNTFQEFRDNIQGYVSAVASNYNQGNPGYRPQGVANQMRPPCFVQPNVQNNQNRFGQPQGFNRRTNFNQEQPYQATTQSNQNFHLNELEKIKRMNDVSMKSMQNQIDMVKNKLRNEMKTSSQTSLSNQTNEIKNMMASLLKMNTASTSGSGSLPGNTVANPTGELKAITTRSELVTD
nr:reverse transcriptase domain-containing protein [Tanacetum cinerariifolium]